MLLKKCLSVVFPVIGLALGLCLLALLAQNSNAARTWEVDDDGGADFTSIQEALNASSEGDEILVAEGIYRESLVVEKNITVRGAGRDVTIINGSGFEVVSITADGVRFSGFMVTNFLKEYGVGIVVQANDTILENISYSVNQGTAIGIRESRNCSITKVFVTDSEYGVSLYSSSGCVIRDCVFSRTWRGVTLRDSDNNTLLNNTCQDSESGIYLRSSEGNLVKDNHCLNNSNNGILLSWSKNCTLAGNEVRENMDGIFLSGCRDLTLTGNLMVKNGIGMEGFSLENWDCHIIGSDNTVNGKPVVYLKDETGLTVEFGAGQVILANCSWMTVSDQDLSQGCVGIQAHTLSNSTLFGNNCSKGSYGIYIEQGENNTIEGNNCSGNRFAGMYLRSSKDDLISENDCSWNGVLGFGSNSRDGIYLTGSRNICINNRCLGNGGNGILLQGTRNNCSSNNCSKNILNGITCIGSWYEDTEFFTISDNICLDNWENGLLLEGSHGCLLFGNRCQGNNQSGIYLDSGSDGCTLKDNRCSGGRYGIYDDSHDVILRENTCSGNEYGFYLGYFGETEFDNNRCQDNEYGIYISSSWVRLKNASCLNNRYGIYLARSSYNSLISCTVLNVVCQGNDYGIYLDGIQEGWIDDSHFLDNKVGIQVKGPYREMDIHNCSISGNMDFGINVSASKWYMVDATGNPWGHESGPFHPEENPDGEGDTVSDFVIFRSGQSDPGIRELEKGQSLTMARFLAQLWWLAVVVGCLILRSFVKSLPDDPLVQKVVPGKKAGVQGNRETDTSKPWKTRQESLHFNEFWARHRKQFSLALVALLLMSTITIGLLTALGAQWTSGRSEGHNTDLDWGFETASDMRTSGDHLYVVDDSLIIFDISDKEKITKLSSFSSHSGYDGSFTSLFLDGDWIYLGDDGGILRVMNVTNRSDPRAVGSCKVGYNNIEAISRQGDHLFLATGSVLSVIDISNRTEPEEVGGVPIPGRGRDLVVFRDTVYMACSGGGLLLFDISNISKPVQVGRRLVIDEKESFVELARSGETLLCMVEAYGDNHVLALDISNPHDPRELWRVDTSATGMEVHDDKLFVAGRPPQTGIAGFFMAADETLNIYDMSKPKNPRKVGCVDISYLGYMNDEEIHVHDNYFYTGDSFDDLYVYELRTYPNPLFWLPVIIGWVVTGAYLLDRTVEIGGGPGAGRARERRTKERKEFRKARKARRLRMTGPGVPPEPLRPAPTKRVNSKNPPPLHMSEKENYFCLECDKTTPVGYGEIPMCCGKHMKKVKKPVCETPPSDPGNARLNGEDEPCDDGR